MNDAFATRKAGSGNGLETLLCRLEKTVAYAFLFGSLIQNRIEKVSPAKNVLAARAVWPPRRPRIADTVQQNMISTIRTMSNVRSRVGVSMR